MSGTTEPPGLHADARTYLAAGTEEEARTWLGREVVRDAPFPVNQPEIGRFCAMVEDPDENHWDEAAATGRFGAIVSPPGMFMVWGFPLPWRPDGRPAHAPLLALEVPLPGATLINVSTATTFVAPMLVGDRLRFHERLTELSPAKATALGTGHFLTTVTDAYRSDGTHVGSNENVLFRYEAAPTTTVPAADRPTPGAVRPRPDADTGGLDEPIPGVEVALTPTRVAAMIPAGTRDLFPGHHDRGYARAQGADDMYINTMFLHGLVDRVGKGWSGPEAWLRRRVLRMSSPACVGSTLRTVGRVVSREVEDGRRMAQLSVDVLANDVPAASAMLRFDLDGWDVKGPRAPRRRGRR